MSAIVILLIIGGLGAALWLALRSADHRLAGFGWGGIVALWAIALLLDASRATSFDLPEYTLLSISGLLIVMGLALTLRPKRRRAALLIFVTGWLTLFLTLLIPIGGATLSLGADRQTDLAPTPGATLTISEVAEDVFERVVQVVASQTGLDTDTITQRMDAGDPIALLIAENNGDLEATIQGITAVMNDQIAALAADGRLEEGQAGLTISLMETVVRAGVQTRLAGLLERFEPTPTPQ